MEDADDQNTNEVDVGENITAEEAHVYPISTATILFQLVMIFVCIYYTMLLTNWGDPKLDDEEYDPFKDSVASFWIKIAA